MNFINALRENEESVTENGAVGFRHTKSALLDLNFKVPSFRKKGIDAELFARAMEENEELTCRWLLFLRDIRGGIGEREAFRSFLLWLIENKVGIGISFLRDLPLEEYGRWDDYTAVFAATENKEARQVIADKLFERLKKDEILAKEGSKNVSLLAKWLPSDNASSQEKKLTAKMLQKYFHLNSQQYRKTLSPLRKYLNVVEVKMSGNRWDEINYEHVPSRANLCYLNAFLKHDKERRTEYLVSVKEGKAKINARAMFLYDICHAYNDRDYGWYSSTVVKPLDETLEEMWKAQPCLAGFSNTLVVRDGSGSMFTRVGSSSVTAIDVANSLTLYCAQNNSGEFRDQFITFSRSPRIISVRDLKTLRDKLIRLFKEDECYNTDIEKVFDLVLKTAVNKKLKQEELPKQILIISDMEFDYACDRPRDNLFEIIADRYRAAGYELPRLIFWNVNSRTNTIPMQENPNGVVLLSGFSQNLARMVMSSEADPFKVLKDVLMAERYDTVKHLQAC